VHIDKTEYALSFNHYSYQSVSPSRRHITCIDVIPVEATHVVSRAFVEQSFFIFLLWRKSFRQQINSIL